MYPFGFLLAGPPIGLWMSASGSLDPISILNTYGWPTFIAFAFFMGWLVPGYLYKQTKTELDQLRKVTDDLVNPALREGIAALAASKRKTRA